MSNSLSIIALLAISLVMGCQQSVAQPTTFTLTSSDIGGQMTTTQVFDGFGCTGNNISPQLSWINAPTETQSFAITMYDPDAPTGSGWWHWLVFNLPSDVTSLASGAGSTDGSALPARAIQSVTSFGTAGYGGPCPPVGHGLHRYVITVYALSVPELPLDSEANPALVGYNLNANAIAKASIIAYFERK